MHVNLSPVSLCLSHAHTLSHSLSLSRCLSRTRVSLWSVCLNLCLCLSLTFSLARTLSLCLCFCFCFCFDVCVCLHLHRCFCVCLCLCLSLYLSRCLPASQRHCHSRCLPWPKLRNSPPIYRVYLFIMHSKVSSKLTVENLYQRCLGLSPRCVAADLTHFRPLICRA